MRKKLTDSDVEKLLTTPQKNYEEVLVTDYPSRGFLLQDGRWLDIGGHQDHRFINGMVQFDPATEESFNHSQSRKMLHIMKMAGMIRFIPESKMFQVITRPTSAQIAEIKDFLVKHGKIEIEFGINNPSKGYLTEDYLDDLTEDLRNYQGESRCARRIVEAFLKKQLEDKAVEFLKKNPSPDDSEVHALADELGVDKHKFEEVIYGLLGKALTHKEVVVRKSSSLEIEKLKKEIVEIQASYQYKLDDLRGRVRGLLRGQLTRFLQTALDASRSEPPRTSVIQERLEDSLKLIDKEIQRINTKD